MSVPQDPILAKARRVLEQPDPVLVKARRVLQRLGTGAGVPVPVPRGMMRLGEADPTLSELKALAQARRKFVEEMAAKQPAAQLRDAMLEQHAPVPFDEFCEVVKDPGKASLELERARQRLEKNPGSAVRITPGIAQLVERRAKHPDWMPTPTGWGLYLASLAPALKEHLDALRRDALFPEAARQEHTLIVAPTGHGKSTLLKALIHHYVAEAPGSAVIVLDPGGDLVRQVARWPELIQGDRLVYIEPELKPGFTVGLNPLDGRGLDERGQNHVAAALARALGEVVNELTDNMRTLVRTTATLLLGTPGATLRDMQVLLRQSAATAAPKRRARVRPGPGIELPPETAVQGDERAAELLALGREHPDEEVADFFASEFEGEYFAPTRNSMAARLRNVLSLIDVRNMMTGPATVHLESLIDARRVILVNLARFGDDGSAMVGRLLVALVAGLVRRRADLPEGARRVPVQLFVDEVTTMVSPQMVRVLAELRKFGLHMTMAQQIAGAGFTTEQKAVLFGNTACKLVVPTDEDVNKLFQAERGKDAVRLGRGEFLVQWGRSAETRRLVVRPDMADGGRGVDDAEWRAFVERHVARYYRPSTAPRASPGAAAPAAEPDADEFPL